MKTLAACLLILSVLVIAGCTGQGTPGGGGSRQITGEGAETRNFTSETLPMLVEKWGNNEMDGLKNGKISNSGRYFAAAGDNNVVLFDNSGLAWSAETGKKMFNVAVSDNGEYTVATSEYTYGASGLTPDEYSHLYVYDRNGNLLKTINAADWGLQYNNQVFGALGVTPEGYIALMLGDFSVIDTTGKKLWTAPLDFSGMYAQLSNDNRNVLMSYNGNIYRRDVKSGGVELNASFYSIGSYLQSLSKDNRLLAGTCNPKMYSADLCVYELNDPVKVSWSANHTEYVHLIRIAPDGQYAATVGWDSTAVFKDGRAVWNSRLTDHELANEQNTRWKPEKAVVTDCGSAFVHYSNYYQAGFHEIVFFDSKGEPRWKILLEQEPTTITSGYGGYVIEHPLDFLVSDDGKSIYTYGSGSGLKYFDNSQYACG
jgi:WD40 repeat protein